MIIPTAPGPLECITAGHPRADGATLVLVHGIQGTASAWGPLLPVLARRWHVLAPHLRGRAGSFAPEDPAAYTIDSFATDLQAVLAQIPGPVVLVGWSMGSLVALAHIRAHGTKGLAGLVLASGSARLDAPGCPPAIWFKGDTPPAIADEASARAARLNLTETATPTAVAGSWISARQVDFLDVLPGIDCPTLILHGAEDPECPPDHARLLARAIPGARLDLWEGCGHVPMAHDPDRCAATLDDFAGRCLG
ncbi:MAG: alpha/beta fold hydrolase [Qingshengfaniella sp.]